jgi:VCBS repeat-containing protein
MLRQQSTSINEQASSSTVELDKLQKAFQNVYATMDEIDTFKVKALDSMQKTVTTLSAEVERSQAYIDRVRANEERGPGLDALG